MTAAERVQRHIDQLRVDNANLREALFDLIGLARQSMIEANCDGAGYDIDSELLDAISALNVKPHEVSP